MVSRRDERRKAALKAYLAKFPKDVLASKKQAEVEAASGYPGQRLIWKLWDEYDRRCGKKAR